MTKEDRILNNQLAIMDSLKLVFKILEKQPYYDSDVKRDQQYLANCCKATIDLLRTGSSEDTLKQHHLEYH